MDELNAPPPNVDEPAAAPIDAEAQTATTQPSQPPIPSSKNSRRNLLIGAAVLVIAACWCVGLCGAVFGIGVVKSFRERPKTEAVVDEFMTAMAAEDTSVAYELFSERAKRSTSFEDLEKLLEGNNFALVDGYRSADVTDIQLAGMAYTDPDLPRGTVARVQGTIAYEGGFTGNFYAVLEKEGSGWRLFNINITVPPDKIGSGSERST